MKEKSANPVKWVRQAIPFLKKSHKWTLNLGGNREDAVRELFPRLLYNFSDVVVHVVACQASRMLENDIAKLLEWAQNSQKTAVKRIILPHLIVVLTFSSDKSSHSDPDKTTSEILHEHLPALESNDIIKKYRRMLEQMRPTPITDLSDMLGHCYSSVKFIRVPYMKNPQLFSKQLQLLDSLIREAAAKAERTKTAAGCLLTSEIERRMFRMAFDHYKDNLDKPFDFLESLFSARPLDDTLSASFFVLLKLAVAAYRSTTTEPSAGEFCSAVTSIMCSTIALEYYRSGEKYPGKLSDIYAGKTINSQGIGGGHNDTATYQSQVAKAINDFFDQACPCEFVSKDGRQCANVRLKHDEIYMHQDITTGETIGYGAFHSAFVDELKLCWNDEIDKSFHELDDLQGKSNALVHPREQSNAEVKTTWFTHCNNLQKLYSTIPKLDIREIETCSWCLHNKKLQLLECGHRICWGCAELVGDCLTDSDDEISIPIRSCDLHPERINFEKSSYIIKLRNGGAVVIR